MRRQHARRTLTAASVAETALRCRFPGPFTRVGTVAQTASGGPLSPYRIAADPSGIRRGDRYEMWFTNVSSRRRGGIARAFWPRPTASRIPGRWAGPPRRPKPGVRLWFFGGRTDGLISEIMLAEATWAMRRAT